MAAGNNRPKVADPIVLIAGLCNDHRVVIAGSPTSADGER